MISRVHNKEKYIEFMNANENVCIYDKPFWLDAVCGKDKWDAVLLEENQQIVAAVPYHKKKRLGIRYFMQPKLTQYFDIWINPKAERKTERYIHYQFQMIEEITKGLLEVGADYYFQMYSPKLHNWEPFCWEGFHQETRYTFRIAPNRSVEDIEAQMSTRMRDEIKQAAKKAVITELEDVDVFCQYQEYAFSQKNMKNPFPKALVRSIYSACKEQNACKMLAVKEDDSICCVGLYVFDNNYVYEILLGTDPIKKNRNYKSFLTFEMIRFACESGRGFDFEGSMIPSIAEHNRRFGAELVPYYQIWKNNARNPFKWLALEWYRMRH